MKHIWIILLIFIFITYTSYIFIRSNIILEVQRPAVKIFQIASIEKITLEDGGIARRKFQLKLSLNEEGRTLRDSCKHEGWRDILRPCQSAMKWIHKNYNNSLRTSLSKSKIELFIKPRGYPSVIKITTKDLAGRVKTYGGDSWLVRIQGKNYSSTIHLKDRLNGRYDGVLNIRQVGGFSLAVNLEYSLCDGLRDPPKSWFRQGICMICSYFCSNIPYC